MYDQRHHELLAHVASLYYEQDMTQNAIADLLGLSRVKVYRLLREARAENVVQINIDWPINRDARLEQQLQVEYSLKAALVLKTSSRQQATLLRQLGQLGARYLENILRHSTTMAICLGRSTYEVINAISSDFQAHVQVAQAIGNLPHSFYEYDSSTLARQLAHKLGGQVMYLPSPLMADTPEAASVIRSQRDVQHTLAVARAADVALVGIGNLDTEKSGFVQAGFMESTELELLKLDGAVGDLAWQIYTEVGALYPCEFNQRVIGIRLEELAHIPTTIAVAAGKEKSTAIRGALNTGVINVLVTDDRTATAVLQLGEAADELTA
jgi:DNA-binding transcriptional regulator LsrR (DeoR family)